MSAARLRFASPKIVMPVRTSVSGMFGFSSARRGSSGFSLGALDTDTGSAAIGTVIFSAIHASVSSGRFASAITMLPRLKTGSSGASFAGVSPSQMDMSEPATFKSPLFSLIQR